MKRRVVDLARENSRGIEALKEGGVTAVFADAVRVDLADCALLFISGVIGTDETGRVVGPTMREQTRQVLEKIKAVLEREGGRFDDVVRVRVYVTHLDPPTLRDIHDVRSHYFTKGNYPASSLVRVAELIAGALIEIDADAVISTRRPRARSPQRTKAPASGRGRGGRPSTR